MTMLMMISIILSLSMTMLTCVSPLSMAINILLIALTTSGLYAAIHSTWLSLLIFLIYIGGMLVMFSYFLAILPNQQKFSSHSIMIPTVSTLIFMFVFSSVIDSWTVYTPMLYQLTTTMFCAHNMPILMLLVLVLLFTMVTVIKVCKLEKGPLRSFMSL
uniref:NADH dehydrogenase subunit 6 n=1 Tax=Limnodrilus hoffmeisteri TaxID=76587 RepID=A0A8F2JFK4_9ANNE|nr:NADH dehydrogenase subunit 6 [Limnodrilus hoffmeisteri]